jgi:CRP/FNR family cyclic AMP-dependent transcriptional regulator
MKSISEDSELIKTSTIREYQKDGQIAKEGDMEVGWYVLMNGRVGVFKRNRQVAEFNKKGVIFGELSSILNTPRTASLIALEPTKVLYFKASIDHLIGRYPEIAKNIMIDLAERLAKTTDQLIALVEKED